MALAFSPDGQLLASGSDDTTALLWDVKTLLGSPPAPFRAREKLSVLGKDRSSEALSPALAAPR